MSTTSQSSAPSESVVTPLKFKQRLQRSDKEKTEDNAQYSSDQAKLKLDGSILETRQEIGKYERALDNLKGSDEFDPQSILEAQTELEAYTKGLAALQALKEELF